MRFRPFNWPTGILRGGCSTVRAPGAGQLPPPWPPTADLGGLHLGARRGGITGVVHELRFAPTQVDAEGLGRSRPLGQGAALPDRRKEGHRCWLPGTLVVVPVHDRLRTRRRSLALQRQRILRALPTASTARQHGCEDNHPARRGTARPVRDGDLPLRRPSSWRSPLRRDAGALTCDSFRLWRVGEALSSFAVTPAAGPEVVAVLRRHVTGDGPIRRALGAAHCRTPLSAAREN